MARLPAAIEADPGELDNILSLEHHQRRAQEMQALSARAATDPQAYEKLRALIAHGRTPG
jgi:hypothetical protein